MAQLQRLVERPQDYYNVDGLGELGVGFMCLGYSLLIGLQLHNDGTSIWRRMPTSILFVLAMSTIIHHGSKVIKERITYPRTGFVAYRRREKLWFPMALGAGISILLVIGYFFAARRHWEISPYVSLIGLLLAASYVRIARTVRWKWLIFCAVVAASTLISVLPPDLLSVIANHQSPYPAIPASAVGAFWLTFVVYGLLLLISGGISLWLYLRQTHASAPEDR